MRSQNYKFRGIAAFVLLADWSYEYNRFAIQSNLPSAIIDEASKDLLLPEPGERENYTKKLPEILDEVAHNVFKMENAKYFFFNIGFNGERGRLLNEKVDELINYRNTINLINEDIISLNANPVLAYLFQQIALSGLFCYDKHISFYKMNRAKFEKKLTTIRMRIEYVNYYREVDSVIEVICDCNNLPSFYAALNKKKQVLMVIIM